MASGQKSNVSMARVPPRRRNVIVLLTAACAAALGFMVILGWHTHNVLAACLLALAVALAQARRWSARRFRESEERLARIVETIADAIFIVDRSGRITFANAAAEQMFGMGRQVMTARVHNDPAWKITRPDGKAFPDDELPFTKVMKTGTAVYDTEIGVERADGSRVVVSVNAAPLLDAAEGRVTGMVASVSDVTRRKEVERLKDEFVSTVSHELRTPLSSLRGFAELMLTRTFPPEKQREFLTIIHNEAVRLTTLINDFLDIQRMESGRERYGFAAVDLGELARANVALFSSEERHRLRLEIPADLPPVWADADRVRQVLSNLISNAIKFSPRGGTVRVGARQEVGQVVVWVADEGMGIPSEVQSQLFTKFFRVDSQETRTIGGTGLGLALIKEIVQAHSGKVWVESEPGSGSTFFFTLPAAQRAADGRKRAKGDVHQAADILLVEDDPSFAKLLCEHFRLEGLRVAAAATGEEALELVRRSPPRLALVDVHLAGRMDGWDLLVAIKGDPVLRSVAVMIISASDTINAKGLAVSGGDFFLKPVSQSCLLEAVQAQIPSRAGKYVLVVDDDPIFRSQVRECLVPEGFEVEEAANGRVALESMTERMPDLLLLDLLMPVVDGFEVLQRLRADKRAVSLPVLVLTGHDLLPEDKAYIKRRMATLVRKREASLEHIAHAVEQILAVKLD